MNVRRPAFGNGKLGECAYTLAELLIAVGFIGLLVFSLYAGFATGFTVIKMSREDLRATQILLQRMETVRLYTWPQLTDTSFVPTTFVERYDPLGQTNGTGGVIYSGKLSISNPPTSSGLPSGYRANMLQVTATVYWTNQLGKSNKVVRSRTMQTYTARYGMQPYVYGQ